MLLGPQGQQAERFSGLPLTQQGSKSPLELPMEMLPGVTAQKLTEAHCRSWLSPVGGCAVGTSLSPTSHHVGPTQAGLGPLAMPPVLPMPPHHHPPHCHHKVWWEQLWKG